VFAEPLAAALEVSQQIHLTNAMRVLVLGDGKLGLLAALGLRRYNDGLVLVGKHAEKLAVAEAAGVRALRVGSAEELPGLARELAPFDVVVEATGSPDGLALALDFVRPEGTVVCKTTTREPASLDLARVVVDEITLLGSRCGDLSLALAFLRDGLVDPEPLVEAAYPLARAGEAFDRARRPGARKVLLDIGMGGA
jgi:threonine dehydrogenase-like Zn-dependent dehydrogenase